MKGLRLFIPPFAPDTSGAAAVLYAAGDMVLIIDAGGCAGNISAFDEPRWSANRTSAVFSAGLRDMDAIMGRDKRLIEKLKRASSELDIRFAALVSTPVPAVIGTDLRALKRLGEQALGLPIVAIGTDGTRLYDSGASATYLAMFSEFTRPRDIIPRSIGVIGITPLDFTAREVAASRAYLTAKGYEHIAIYGIDEGLVPYENAAAMEQNIVVSPAGLVAAKYLKTEYGTPYSIGDAASLGLAPTLATLQEQIPASAKNILIIHQQLYANALRIALEPLYPVATIRVATFFGQETEFATPQDIAYQEEDEFIASIAELAPDVIIADPLFRRALPHFSGKFIALPHFAVSGADGAVI